MMGPFIQLVWDDSSLSVGNRIKAYFVCSLCGQIVEKNQEGYHYKIHEGIWHGDLWKPIKDAKILVIGNLAISNRQCDVLKGFLA